MKRFLLALSFILGALPAQALVISQTSTLLDEFAVELGQILRAHGDFKLTETAMFLSNRAISKNARIA
ncbi:hypothetical protein [Cerasicoccus maritimus]|uniref:hypothetical protein n=1 Tax=Cerasicoccus maritimus TaxID=490089 RepID=UPI002852BB6D|nr:hypothetical protein [Cerasicoccus maritimus]